MENEFNSKKAKAGELNLGKLKHRFYVTGCDAGSAGCGCMGMGQDPGIWIDKGRPSDEVIGKVISEKGLPEGKIDFGKLKHRYFVTGCDAGTAGCGCSGMGQDPGIWIDKGRPSDEVIGKIIFERGLPEGEIDFGKLKHRFYVTGCDAGTAGCGCSGMGQDPGIWIDKGRPSDVLLDQNIQRTGKIKAKKETEEKL